ncbi:MAG: hypothetical protein KGJ92_01595 [Actinomycetales bacterium]|nr:hypothetical protein [Actinomycetales bacterium]
MSESSPTPDREPDLVDRALGTLDHALDVVHDKFLRPILLAGRTVAFIFVFFLVGLVLVSVLIIGIIRLFNVYFFANHVWLSYALVGVLSLTAGLLIWRRRRPLPQRKNHHD